MTALKTPDYDAPAEEWGALAVSIPGFQYPSPMPRCLVDDEWGPLPDPDHWAWWGWFIELLQPIGFGVGTDEDGVCNVSLWETDEDGNSHEGTGRTIGRACIAAAAAIGRWPGGDL